MKEASHTSAEICSAFTSVDVLFRSLLMLLSLKQLMNEASQYKHDEWHVILWWRGDDQFG